MDWERALEPYVIQAQPITQIYDFKEKLGQGTFGYVFLAEPKKVEAKKDTDNQTFSPNDKPVEEKVAIKILKKQKIQESKQGLEFLLNEIRVHWALE